MNINPLGVRGVYQANAQKLQGINKKEKIAAVSDKTDTVSLSSDSMFQRELARASSEAAKSAESAVSPARLARIEREVAQGTYYVPSDMLADAIIGRAVGA